MKWLDGIRSYGRAVDTVATTFPDVFAQWLDQAAPDVRDALLSRDVIAGLLRLRKYRTVVRE